jgi:hypothetical protein
MDKQNENEMGMMEIESKLSLLRVINLVIVSPLNYPDREDMKVWSENSLKLYAKMIKKQMDNNTYDLGTKEVQHFLKWASRENKINTNNICDNCDLDNPSCNNCIGA